MDASRERLIELARTHATCEGGGDMEGTLATLERDPVYELQPVGLAFRGMAAARVFYEHFFASFQPLIEGYELRSEFAGEEGVAQEYVIALRSTITRTLLCAPACSMFFAKAARMEAGRLLLLG